MPFTDQKYHIPIERSPFHKGNIKAYKALKVLMDKNRYTIIHCHTPLGGALARLASKAARRTGVKVIYTAHGFHFCKGASLLNWLIYYPIEKHLAQYTDCLITINSEDYSLAVDHHFPARSIELVNGVGVDTYRFQPVSDKQKKELRFKLGFKQDEFLLFYAAEFNKNKNQQLLIKAMANLKDELPKARLLLAGEGHLLEECRGLADKLHVSKQVDFLGFRKDIDQILPACDAAVGSSFREGLPVNIMEAMACGLPVIASDNRGHRELVKDGWNGYLIQNMNDTFFSNAIMNMHSNKELRNIQGMSGRQLILSKYDKENVLRQVTHIYKEFMNEKEGVLWEAR